MTPWNIDIAPVCICGLAGWGEGFLNLSYSYHSKHCLPNTLYCKDLQGPILTLILYCRGGEKYTTTFVMSVLFIYKSGGKGIRMNIERVCVFRSAPSWRTNASTIILVNILALVQWLLMGWILWKGRVSKQTILKSTANKTTTEHRNKAFSSQKNEFITLDSYQVYWILK